jgi:dTDP-N-acetylfucosamine:lipid II N-acetylfucosaminyltransferase
MILHVASPSTFIGPFIKLIKEEFCEENHQFWLLGAIEKFPVEKSKMVFVYGSTFWDKVKAYVRLVLLLHSAKKVMLHGLFNVRLVLILALCPWLLSKCYWIIWGGDLYQYSNANSSIKARIKEPIRKFVLRRIGHLVTYIKGDVDLARKWYGAKGIYHECLMYLSNVVGPIIISAPAVKTEKNGLYILLGNSADPNNNHIEALEHLLPYKDQDIKIFVPLSYGDQVYAKMVISQGSEWFGEKFVPLTEFMPFDCYLEFLKSLDIAIFNHQRQQAMGNTITLLGLGKTVYLRSDVSQWGLFEKEGIKVFDIEQFELVALDSQVMWGNVEKIKKRFSRENLMEQYCEIFEN